LKKELDQKIGEL
jgi:midasin (ATPase involved in ribosome maturation)